MKAVFGHGPTRREQQILEAIEAGQSVAQTAGQLGLSEAYVSARAKALSGIGGDKWIRAARRSSSLMAEALAQYRGVGFGEQS